MRERRHPSPARASAGAPIPAGHAPARTIAVGSLGAAVLALLSLPVAPANAQTGQSAAPQPYTGGILPGLGSDTRVGDLRTQLESFLSPQPTLAARPAWLVTPSIGTSLGFTDNALRVESPRRADVFTLIDPAVAVSGDTARLKVNLNYSPQIALYGQSSSQNRVDQYFDGSATGIIVPDAVFIDLRGNISQTSRTGNSFNQGATGINNRQNDVQSISYSVTPHAEHRFGGYGTARLGVSYARTLQDASNGQNNNANAITALQTLGTPAYGATGNLSTTRERASFTSGENLGRFNDLIYAEAYQYGGGGSYTNAHRNQVQNELGYAVTRRITALGGLGYQDIQYSGTPILRINEPTWNVGARYNPNPDTTVTILYGRRDGISSVSFDGTVAPTARTRLIGRYSTGLTTDLEDTQNLLETTSVGPTGILTDNATGAPIGTSGGGGGLQNGVYRLRRLSIEGLLLQDRDSYALTLSMEDRTTVTNAPTLTGNGIVPAGTSSNSVVVSSSWQHELAPTLSSTASVQYATTNSTSKLLTGSTGQQRTLSLTASLNKQLTETLSGNVRYTYTDQSGGNANTGFLFGPTDLRNNGSYTENLVLIGLRKSF